MNESFTLRRHYASEEIRGASASILPKAHRLNGAIAAYLARRWVSKAIRFYAWAVHSKAFHIRSRDCRGFSRQPAAIWTG
jgi:hypothetical protein